MCPSKKVVSSPSAITPAIDASGFEDTRPAVYHRHLNVTIQDITAHRRLHNYLLLYYRRNYSTLDFAPGIYSILNSVPSLAFVPCFLLAYTMCRISELDQITVSKMKTFEPFLIRSTKSDFVKSVPALDPFKKNLLLSVPDRTEIMVISYDSLKNSIASARSRHKILVGDNALDCTHIFRHLQGTFLSSKGVDLHEISYKLGHKIDKTTLQYIHRSVDVNTVYPNG